MRRGPGCRSAPTSRRTRSPGRPAPGPLADAKLPPAPTATKTAAITPTPSQPSAGDSTPAVRGVEWAVLEVTRAIDEIAEKVEALVVQACGLDEGAFRPEAPLRGYGLDSVRAVDLVVSLEEAFGIAISDLEAAGMVTGRDVADLVRRRRAS